MNLLSHLSVHPLARGKRQRLGRGRSSGRGGTSTKGHKGQRARAGRSIPNGFEGGQMSLVRRIPKFGFTNGRFRKHYDVWQVSDLNRFCKKGEKVEVTPELLMQQSCRSISGRANQESGVLQNRQGAAAASMAGKANTLKERQKSSLRSKKTFSQNVKIIGTGVLDGALVLRGVHRVSKGACKAIEKAGGHVVMESQEKKASHADHNSRQKTEDTRVETAKGRDTTTADTKTERTKEASFQTTDTKVKDTKAEDVKTMDFKTDTASIKNVPSGDTHTKSVHSEAAKDSTKAKDVKTSSSQGQKAGMSSSSLQKKDESNSDGQLK